MKEADDNGYNLILKKAKKRIVYTYHATVQMSLEKRLITIDEIRDVIFQGTIIETRTNDARGDTFLLNGKTYMDRYIHVVCSPKEDFLVVVTAYLPSKAEWVDTFSKRIKS